MSEALASLSPEVEALQAVLENLRRSVHSLRETGLQLGELMRRLPELELDISNLETQAKRHEVRVAGFEAALDRRDEIERRFAELVETRARLTHLEQVLARKHELEQAGARLEQELAVQTATLSAEGAQLRKTLTEDLTPKAAALEAIECELRDLGEKRESHGELEVAMGESQEEAQKMAGRLQYLEQANSVLRVEMEQSRDKFDMLELGDNRCPLCDQALGTEGKEHLRREFQAQGMEMKRRYSDNSQEHKTLEGDAERIARRLTQLGPRRRSGPSSGTWPPR